MNSNSLFDPSIRYDEPLTIYTRDINAIGDVSATEGTVAARTIAYGSGSIYRLGTGDQYAEFLPLAQATGISAQVTPAGVNSGLVSINSIGGMVRKSHGVTQKPGFTTYQAYDYSFQIAITITGAVAPLSDIQLRVDCTSQVGATGVRYIGGGVGSVGQSLQGIATSGNVLVGADAAPGTGSGAIIVLSPAASGGWNNGVGGTFSLLVNVFFTVVGPQLINF